MSFYFPPQIQFNPLLAETEENPAEMERQGAPRTEEILCPVHLYRAGSRLYHCRSHGNL